MGFVRVVRKSMINFFMVILVKEFEEDERGEKVFVGCYFIDLKVDDMI